MSDITAERWASLKAMPREGGVLAEPVDPDIPGCLIGVDDDSCLHLMIAISEQPDEIPQDLEAVVVRVIESDQLYLDISTRGHFEMIFTPIARQMFFGVTVQGRKPIDVVNDTIIEFRGALKPTRATLSLSEQIGLVGELWVLRNVLIPALGTQAARHWSGPHAERHDFVGEKAHLEVKTTTRSDDRHEISRQDQLKAPEGKKLLLASIQLEKTEAGEITVATLIDEVMTDLATDGLSISAFQSSLARLQWHDELRQSGEVKRFSLRNVQFFEVEGTFPRLPDDYSPPRGIVAIRYTIDLSSRAVLDQAFVNGIVATM
jgi:hypothetical protein